MSVIATNRRSIVTASVAALIGLVILLSLGTWQLARKVWKEDLIATVTARIDKAPEGLSVLSEWRDLDDSSVDYVHVKFTATFLPGEAFIYTSGSSLRPDVKEQGYWVFARARTQQGGILLVNRGFVPTARKDPATRAEGMPKGPVDIVGYTRWPESAGLFTPNDDPKANVFFTRNPQAIAAAQGWTIDAPFYVDQEGPVPPGGLPKPGRIDVQLPNRHFEYALTWYGLALTLIGVYGVWLAARLRRRDVP